MSCIYTFLYILESYRHRADVRKALTLDKNWNDKCFSKILPMFVSQVGTIEQNCQYLEFHCQSFSFLLE